MPLGIFLAPAHKGPDGGGSGIENGDSVFGDDGPEPVPVGIVGRAFVHHRGGAVGQGPVDDVAMAGYPTDVRGAPVNVFLFQVEDPLCRGVGAHQVAAGGVDDPFRLAGGAAGIQEIEHVLAVHGLRLAGQRLVGHQVVPPHVAALHHAVIRVAGTPHHHYFLDGGRTVQRLVDVLLEFNDAAPPVAAVGGDNDLRLGVVDPVADRFGAKATEHHAVGSADASASQHGDWQLRNHRQVYGHPVALFHSQALQPVGKPAHLAVQVPVGIYLAVAGFSLPDQCCFVAPGRAQVPVDAVVGYVDLAPGEPFCKRRVPLQYLVPLLEPVQFLGKFGPESLGVL